jgi:16S rRNA (guanine1516-N2)-methyltransferase
MSRYLLQETDNGLRLVDRFSHQHPLQIKFSGGRFGVRLKKGVSKKELIAKAAAAKPGVRVIDCTAGLGRDAFILASLGCDVTMFERSRVMSLLLQDALDRALLDEKSREAATRVSLVCGDAINLLEKLPTATDVILIDPMFPEKKKSAMVKGEMQFLQRFLGKDEDAGSLLQAALDTGVKRVVLKRPLSAEESGEPKPSHCVKGKSSRFDVYLQ